MNIEELINKAIIEGNGHISPLRRKMICDSYCDETFDVGKIDDLITTKIEHYKGGAECPNCGANVEAFQFKCSSCGYVYFIPEDAEINIDIIVYKLERKLRELIARPVNGIFDSAVENFHIVLFVIASVFLTINITYFAIFFHFKTFYTQISIAIYGLSILSIVAKRMDWFPKNEFKIFKRQLADFEVLAGLARKHYGQDENVKKMLDLYDAEIEWTKSNFKRRLVLSMIGYGLIAGIVGLTSFILETTFYYY